MLATTMHHRLVKKAVGRNERPTGPREKRWGLLLLWVFLVWSFIYALCPLLQRNNSTIRQLSTYIEESGIDAGAIYYTEVEEVGDADLAIRNTFRFYLDEQKLKNR